MNIIKRTFVVASAAVMCALPLASSIADKGTFFSSNSITASAADYTTNYKKFPSASRANGYYESWVPYDEVKWIQAAYNWLITYYTNSTGQSKIDVDGYYGPKTAAAVKYIQRTTFKNRKGQTVGKITEDGYCGKDTQAKMKKLFY